MKKYISLFVYVTFAVICISCTSGAENNEDDGMLNIPSSCTIFWGDKYQLGSYQNWISTNSFIASVDGSGTITANHAGSCNIYCAKGNCDVNVIPTKTLYEEPICGYDVTPYKITSKHGEPSHWDVSIGYILYVLESPSIPYMYFKYNTTTGRMIGAMVIVKGNLRNQFISVH